jgi:hypothetical protein
LACSVLLSSFFTAVLDSVVSDIILLVDYTFNPDMEFILGKRQGTRDNEAYD